MSLKIAKDISLFHVIVLFLLGVLIALSAFLIWEYRRLQTLSENLRKDVVTIVQSYNNLVVSLQKNGVLTASEKPKVNP